MSQEEEKKIEENQNEENKEIEKEEILIFSPENIDEIYEDINPLEKVSKLLESHHRKKYLNPNFDPEKILAKAEFHVNNLIYIIDKRLLHYQIQEIKSMINLLAVKVIKKYYQSQMSKKLS